MNTAVECPSCRRPVEVAIEDLEAGLAQCPECLAGIVPPPVVKQSLTPQPPAIPTPPSIDLESRPLNHAARLAELRQPAPSLRTRFMMAGVGFLLLLIVIDSITSDPTPRPVQTTAESEPAGQSTGLSTAAAYSAAKRYVRAQLKAPSTAKFSSLLWDDTECGHALQPGNTAVAWGWVDAQNGFGAVIRTRWVVEMKWTGAAWVPNRISIQ